VYRLLTEGTVEARVAAMHDVKQTVADEVVNEGNSAASTHRMLSTFAATTGGTQQPPSTSTSAGAAAAEVRVFLVSGVYLIWVISN